jgi:hypothetical protein
MLAIFVLEGNANQTHNKIPPQTSQISDNLEYQQPQMLARMQEIQTLIHCWWEYELAMENYMETCLKTKNRSAI